MFSIFDSKMMQVNEKTTGYVTYYTSLVETGGRLRGQTVCVCATCALQLFLQFFETIVINNIYLINMECPINISSFFVSFSKWASWTWLCWGYQELKGLPFWPKTFQGSASLAAKYVFLGEKWPGGMYTLGASNTWTFPLLRAASQQGRNSKEGRIYPSSTAF